ncbi:MAG: OmpA family protein [Chromatiales bacterium]|nr:OmpA family protein [Gammaproteobacteria bacterium]MBW6477407.1 OmpA family protein [Chromatiales bacterium]
MKRFVAVPLVAALVLSMSIGLSGCASTGENGEGSSAIGGAIIGGLVGGVLANNTGNRSQGRTAVGVVAGAAAGAAIGNAMDEKERKIRTIAAERDEKSMQVERLQDDLLRVSVASEASFGFDSAALRPEFKPTLNQVAAVVRDDPKFGILVIGHTDSIGSREYNQRLSERRAQSVVDYLRSQGVASHQIGAEGRGMSEPRASNATEEGRAQNRRVEIYMRQY